MLLGIFGDRDLDTFICEPFGTGGLVGAAESPQQREFVNSFGDNGFFCSVCADDYSECFTNAVSVINTTCENFIPPV